MDPLPDLSRLSHEQADELIVGLHAMVTQLMARVAELLADPYGLSISQGTVNNLLRRRLTPTSATARSRACRPRTSPSSSAAAAGARPRRRALRHTGHDDCDPR